MVLGVWAGGEGGGVTNLGDVGALLLYVSLSSAMGHRPLLALCLLSCGALPAEEMWPSCKA